MKLIVRSDQYVWWQSDSITPGFDFVPEQFAEKH